MADYRLTHPAPQPTQSVAEPSVPVDDEAAVQRTPASSLGASDHSSGSPAKGVAETAATRPTAEVIAERKAKTGVPVEIKLIGESQPN